MSEIIVGRKKKIQDTFNLPRFGPTEFKTLLVALGTSLSIAMLWGVAASSRIALISLAAMIVVGAIYLPIQLYVAVREVNSSVHAPDTSEWITR